MSEATQTTSVAVYVCTYQRNEPLARLIDSVRLAAKHVQPEIEVALVVVDDNPDGRARSVVDQHNHGFIRGVHYRHSGAQNISIARNLGIETCLGLADWVAMADDDQGAVEEWLLSLFKTQRTHGADAVTGPVYLRYSSDSPRWLSNQPFHEILEAPTQPEGAKVHVCSTGNSMLSADFLRANPEIRFKDELGEVGGEDMVFYKEAVAAGLDARYSQAAVCYGEQPPERSNLRYQLRASMWMGNSEYLTNIESGSASRSRMLMRAAKRSGSYLSRFGKRIVSGKSPQVRFLLAGLAQTLGIVAGAAGLRIKHL